MISRREISSWFKCVAFCKLPIHKSLKLSATCEHANVSNEPTNKSDPKTPLQAVVGVICDALAELGPQDQGRVLLAVAVTLGIDIPPIPKSAPRPRDQDNGEIDALRRAMEQAAQQGQGVQPCTPTPWEQIRGLGSPRLSDLIREMTQREEAALGVIDSVHASHCTFA